jgi:hypothetical protein
MKDCDGVKLKAGDDVIFFTSKLVRRPAKVIGRDELDVDRISCMIKGDPFPVGILPANLKKGKGNMSTTAVKPDRKELRKQAKALKIDGYQEMSTKQLAKAIAAHGTNGKSKVTPPKKTKRGQTKADKGEPVTPSQKAKAAKSKAKTKTEKPAKSKKSKAKAAPATEGNSINPFRPDTNNYLFTEAFLKGGVRSKIIEKLLKKVQFRPWAKKLKDIDPAHEMDKRMLMCTHQLQHKHGFTVVHYGGRGPEKASVRVFPPGVEVPAELVAKAKLINGVKPGEAPKKAKRTTKKTAKAPATKKKAASKPKASTTKPKKAGAAKKATKATKAKKTTKKAKAKK